ncbi:MAG: hypothetical protein WDW36_009409 [Sanguina aurantia]
MPVMINSQLKSSVGCAALPRSVAPAVRVCSLRRNLQNTYQRISAAPVDTISHVETSAPHSASSSPTSNSSSESTTDNLTSSPTSDSQSAFMMTFALSLFAAAPAHAVVLSEAVNPFQGDQAPGLYATLALFLLCVPGIWSQVKRAPVAAKKRIVFEVPGPDAAGSMPLDARAREVFKYFKTYNYELKSTGDVISFVGNYKADRGQAAAVTFYTFFGLASIALKGERQEEMRIKMVTADTNLTTDIIVEGDKEEIERMRKELNYMEKGKIYVKGILEK